MYLYGELAEDLPVTQGDSPVLLIDEVLFFSIGDLSSAYKRKLFNVIRGQSLAGFTPHAALFNGHPEQGGSELAGSNYARVPVTFSAPDKEPSGITITRNIIRTNFARPTAGWGTWTFTAVYDSLTAGECVWLQQRPTAKELVRGVMPFVDAGSMTCGIN